jgi:hypothetical protein
MQAIKILLIIFIIVKVSSISLPNDGKFHTNFYADNKCTIRIPQAQTLVFPVNTSSCWLFSEAYSVKPKSYDKNTSDITLDVFTTTDCSGDKLATDVIVKTDGTACYAFGEVFYKIQYSNVSIKEDFKLITFENQDCTNQLSAKLFKGKDYCWNLFGDISVTALNWNKDLKELQGIFFENDNTCSTFEVNPITQQANFLCDGSCLQYLANDIYYTCSYDSSAKLIFSLFTLLVLFIGFI